MARRRRRYYRKNPMVDMTALLVGGGMVLVAGTVGFLLGQAQAQASPALSQSTNTSPISVTLTAGQMASEVLSLGNNQTLTVSPPSGGTIVSSSMDNQICSSTTDGSGNTVFTPTTQGTATITVTWTAGSTTTTGNNNRNNQNANQQTSTIPITVSS